MNFIELEKRIETVFDIFHKALFSHQLFCRILVNDEALKLMYPNLESIPDKLKMKHIIGNGQEYTMTKSELLNSNNFELFKAWQIAYCIIGMVAIFEYYLKKIIEQKTGKAFNGQGVYQNFEKHTGIKLGQEAKNIKNIRNLILHNLARVDEKYIKGTNEDGKVGAPYVFFPSKLARIKKSILEIAKNIEIKLQIK